MFTSFIFKLTGYCNLNCSYCYMFNSADRTFERKPTLLSPDIAAQAVRTIREHAVGRGIPRVSVTLHGGEPTLWPLENFRTLFRAIEEVRTDGLEVDLSLQTNLLRIPSRDLLAEFDKARVSLGVSLDGPRHINDRNRYDFASNGSYDRIIRSVRSLHEAGFGHLFGGFLCVMQPDIPPVQFLDWVTALPVTRITLLWPLEFNQATPPWEDEIAYAAEPRFGTWLTQLFDAWIELDRPEIDIRFFTQTVHALLGGPPQRDDIGPWSFQSLVINTDGDLELPDYMRTSSDGAAGTGFNVCHDRLDDVASSAQYARQKASAEAQPEGCAGCPYWTACRGGTLSGRLAKTGEVTNRPSVLCHDHRRFYDTVASRVRRAASFQTFFQESLS